MIRITKKIGSDVPHVLISKGIPTTNGYKATYESTGSTDFKFDRDIYAHEDVKTQLIALQDGKCCFCESKITHISYGDVEHYRPKAGWVQDDEPFNKPGYYWLAYDWDNLLLSCQICNQKHKKNYFPLINPANRATHHTKDIEKEQPLLIHPVLDVPEDHIEFNEEVSKPLNNSIRGRITIDKLGLNRQILNEERKKRLNTFRIIYLTAIGETPREIKEQAKNYILNSLKQDSDYSSMFRCFIKKNPIDF